MEAEEAEAESETVMPPLVEEETAVKNPIEGRPSPAESEQPEGIAAAGGRERR